MSSFHQKSTSSGHQHRKSYHAKLCFLLDTTGSMGHVRDAVLSRIEEIVNYVDRKYPMISIKFGFLGYKDVSDGDARYQSYQFTDEPTAFMTFLRNVPITGGGDEAEDVLGGMDEALKQLNWEDQLTDVKVIIHVGDSPHHGPLFHDVHDHINDHHSNLQDQPRPYSDILMEYTDRHIDYTFIQVKNPLGRFTTSKMVRLFAESYDSNPSRKKRFMACAIDEFSPQELLASVKSSLNSSLKLFMKSISIGPVAAVKPTTLSESTSLCKDFSKLSTIKEETTSSSGSKGTEVGLDIALARFGKSSDPKPSSSSSRTESASGSGSVRIGSVGGSVSASKTAVDPKPLSSSSRTESASGSGSVRIGFDGASKR